MNEKYWTDVERDALRTVTDYHQLSEVALRILEKRVTEERRPLVEICGPMSSGGFGTVERNLQLFKVMIESAIAKEVPVFDQLPFQEAMERLSPGHNSTNYATDILHVFYRRIFRSGFVGKLDFICSWYTSYGGTWELHESLTSHLHGVSIQRADYPIKWLPEYWQTQLQPFLQNPLWSVCQATEGMLFAHCRQKLSLAA